MVTQASVFTLDRDNAGLYPILSSQDVEIKWLMPEDEWLAVSSRGKGFSMFDNGTTLDGSLSLKPNHSPRRNSEHYRLRDHFKHIQLYS